MTLSLTMLSAVCFLLHLKAFRSTSPDMVMLTAELSIIAVQQYSIAGANMQQQMKMVQLLHLA